MSEDAFERVIRGAVRRKSEIAPIALLSVFVIFVLFVWSLWASGSGGLAIWAGAASVKDSAVPVRTATAGAWGDSFGGFNALFGALGFAAIASTLYLQYQALREQRREQHVSRFEETFFRLLDLMRSLRSEIEYSQTALFKRARKDSIVMSDERTKGFDAIRYAFLELQHWTFKQTAKNKKREKSQLGVIYDNYILKRFESRFSPYFRIIYTILHKTRYDPVLTEKEKFYYGNIVRAQLTSYDIGLLAFNSTSKVSKDLFNLICYFRLLKYMPLKRRRVFGEIFPSEAYEARD
jgi:hypothetical protein